MTVDVLIADGTAYDVQSWRTDAQSLAPLGKEPLPKLLWALLPGGLLLLVLLVSAPLRAKRRPGGAARPRPYRVPPARDGSAPRAAPTGAPSTPADRIYEAATRQHKQRRRPRRVTVSSPQARVSADLDTFTVEHSTNGTWRSHLTLPWRDISDLVFDHDHRDPVVSLYVIPAQGTRRHALDSSHLTAADWTRLADAVAANTDGRILLDLSARDGHHVNPDA